MFSSVLPVSVKIMLMKMKCILMDNNLLMDNRAKTKLGTNVDYIFLNLSEMVCTCLVKRIEPASQIYNRKFIFLKIEINTK